MYVAGLATVVLLTALFVHTATRSGGSRAAADPTTAPKTSKAAHPAKPASATSARAAGSAATPDQPLAALVAAAGHDGVSVAALNTGTGRRVTAGAADDMVGASVTKVQILETMLLEHEQSKTTLTDREDALDQQMIENSDNDAADALVATLGTPSHYLAEEEQLGLSATSTVPGANYVWGLTTTSASQQLILLQNLIGDDSPLDAASQQYALNLMEHVEADQRWGVPAAADANTSYAVKNGWLAVDADDDRWAVNSDAIVTVAGQRLLVAVLTQHDSDLASGIALAEKLAKAAAAELS